MIDVQTIRFTVPVVPFGLKYMNFDAEDDDVNSPLKTIGRLADLVGDKIGRHTDDFALWNRYAQSCLQKGGHKIIKYCISFEDDDKKNWD